MLIDMHNHIAGRSHDSSLHVGQLVTICNKRRINAVCITDHDNWMSTEESEFLSAEHNFLILNGIELSAGINGHFLCFGDLKKLNINVHVSDLRNSLQSLMDTCNSSDQSEYSSDELLNMIKKSSLFKLASGESRFLNRLNLIHDQGGYVVWAHPLSNNNLRRCFDVFFHRYPYDKTVNFVSYLEQNHNDIYQILKCVDALEGMNGSSPETGLVNKQVMELASFLEKPVTGGSDAHDRTGVGKCATQFDDDIQRGNDFICALKSGKFRPVSITEDI